MTSIRLLFRPVLGVGILFVLILSFSNCSGPLIKRPEPGANIAVGSRDVLFVVPPVLSDTAQAALAALGWGDGRFQAELQKELAYQFERWKVPITEDSAEAEAWMDVRIDAYEVGKKPSYECHAELKTEAGERRIVARRPRTGKAAERSDPTLDHIREMAESLASQASHAPAAAVKEPPPQMWLIF